MTPQVSRLAVLTAVFLSLLFILPPSANAQASTVDMKAFMGDYDVEGHDFRSYNVGDVVTITDTIAYIRYSPDEDISQVWFRSTEEGVDKFNLTFLGNLKEDLQPGEEVELKVRIVDKNGGEWFEYGRSDLSIVKQKEVISTEKGLNIFGYHLPLPKVVDNNLGHFALYALMWLVVAVIVYFLLSPVLRGIARKTETEIDDIVIDIIKTPVLVLIALYGMVQSLVALGVSYELYQFIMGIYNLGMILVVFYLAYKIYKRVLIYLGIKMAKKKKPELSHTLIPVVEKVGSITILFLAVMYVSKFAGWDMTGFLAGAGIIGLVIAFAAQETLGNFFAGIFLILDPRFKVGDEIEMEGNYYRVTNIGMRTTELYDLFQHITVIMPNSHIANSKITVLSAPDRNIKTAINFGVAYGTDPKRVEEIALDVARSNPNVLKAEDKGPIVRFTEMADSSLNFKLIVWVRDLDDMWRVRSEITEALYRRLGEEGIEIPFPQRTVWIKKEA